MSGAEQLAHITAVLAAAAKACGTDRGAVITVLLGALASICVCSADGQALFQVVQDELAHVRTLCLAATTSPVPA